MKQQLQVGLTEEELEMLIDFHKRMAFDAADREEDEVSRQHHARIAELLEIFNWWKRK